MTITKLTTPLLLGAALLFTSACDSEDSAPTDERAAELDADFSPELEAGPPPGAHGEHHGKRHHQNPAAHLCEELDCSDEQREQIEALLRERHEAHRAEREGKREQHHAARAEHDAALAAAFRADELDLSALEQLRGEHDRGERLESMAQLAVDVHALLTPEQRQQLAAKIGERGPMFMHGGKRGHHRGKHHGEAGKEGKAGKHHDRADRLARHVERFCEPIACSEAQQTQLAAAFEGAHDARKDAPKPDFTPFAEAFAGDELEVQTLVELMRAAKEQGAGAHAEGMGGVLSEVHAILTPEQRGTLADKIEAEGMHSVLGKGHGKRGHGKRGHGKRGPR